MTHSDRTLTHHRIVYIVVLTLMAASIGGCCGAFDRYVNRSKTAEAYAHLDRMMSCCTDYYYGEMVSQGANGEVIPAHFPRPVEDIEDTSQDKVWEATTHSGGVPRGEKVMPDANFDEGVWSAMGFDILDPTFFAYTYRTGGHAEKAWCELVAEGDLDGDGETSRYSRRCEVDPDTLELLCESTLIENEFE